MADFAALYAELDLEPLHHLPVLSRVAIAAFRGLAIAELVQGPDAKIDECIEFLIHLFQVSEGMGPDALNRI